MAHRSKGIHTSIKTPITTRYCKPHQTGVKLQEGDDSRTLGSKGYLGTGHAALVCSVHEGADGQAKLPLLVTLHRITWHTHRDELKTTGGRRARGGVMGRGGTKGEGKG